MAKKCQICGNYSGIYPLCYTHLKMKDDGDVVQCAKCFAWHLKDVKCKCQKYTELPSTGFKNCVVCKEKTDGHAFCLKHWKEFTHDEMLEILNGDIILQDIDKEKVVDEFIENKDILENEEKKIIIDYNNKSKCITCGKKIDSMLFCSSCYNKYKNKELLFRITNCVSVELLDDEYEGRYTCKDGHIVKSKSERDIDNYLYENKIRHAYEKPLSYGANDNEFINPDFYLPDYLGEGKHVYIEHWGYNENNIQYTKTKKFKMPIYKQLGITLICTYEKSDSGKIDSVLEQKLNRKFIKENQINFEK